MPPGWDAFRPAFRHGPGTPPGPRLASPSEGPAAAEAGRCLREGLEALGSRRGVCTRRRAITTTESAENGNCASGVK